MKIHEFAYHVLGTGYFCQFIKPFIPEFQNWTLPFLNLDSFTESNRGFSIKSKIEWQTV